MAHLVIFEYGQVALIIIIIIIIIIVPQSYILLISPNEKMNNRGHLNFATLNFLNFIEDQDLSTAAVEQMKKYGVGSCGPRGFYGTFDVHLELEEILAKYLGVEKAVIYSYGAATFSSAIPSYSKRTDVIFADEGISPAAYQGLVASRSHVRFFRHNDMEHLEQLLMAQAKKDKEDPKRAMLTRRFFVVDGLYLNYGDICPLPDLIALKYKYKVRILLDETVSFGVLGKTGRGVTEYFGVDVEDIDLISGKFIFLRVGHGLISHRRHWLGSR
ncbi:unnamed protein product [Trichobilharzia regenti]|nr:unnamed protein product [Trichobilharzia regenti]